METKFVAQTCVVAFVSVPHVITWSEVDNTFKHLFAPQKVPIHRGLNIDIRLCAAKVLISTTCPMQNRRALISAVSFVVKHDHNLWVRMRGRSMLGMLYALGTSPVTYLPVSSTVADRARYIAMSYLAPLEYGSFERVLKVCLTSTCPHVYTILLCLKQTSLPKEIHLAILNYL